VYVFMWYMFVCVCVCVCVCVWLATSKKVVKSDNIYISLVCFYLLYAIPVAFFRIPLPVIQVILVNIQAMTLDFPFTINPV
jgi:regulator of protease activity HflC (stomatin/prohibitin superfamily)